jgi:hypothetical protein
VIKSTKRVFVCSPLRSATAAGVASNVAYAEKLCAAVCAAGHAPFASHLLYPRFLDDNDFKQREAGIAAGCAWLSAADELWVSTRYGISDGMTHEIQYAMQRGIPVIFDPPAWAGISVLAADPAPT